MKAKFQSKYKKTEVEKMSEILINYVGQPISTFIDYLEKNYSRHCVPSDVASGLANLPLPYIWLDQNKTSIKTTQKLPTGESLDGKKTYDMILPYFTTSKAYTAKTIFELGIKQRDKLYSEAIEITKELTGKNETTAVAEFKIDLDDPKHFFNSTVIPENENDEEGGRRCKDMESAKMNCPVRYKAMQDWFAEVRVILARIEPMTIPMFYMTGDKATTPSCPLKMVAKFNPSSGSQSYSSTGKKCLSACRYKLPFFLKRPGPKYNLYSVAGHEGRPGHHTQVIQNI